MPPCAAWSLSPHSPHNPAVGCCGQCIPIPALWPWSAWFWEKGMGKHSEMLFLPWGCGDALEGRDLLYKWFTLKV